MKKILITGFNGFVGRHACREFSSRGYEVLGISNSQWLEEYSELVDDFTQCDLSSSSDVNKLNIRGVNVVLNLAGYATNSGGDGEAIKKINVAVHTNLLNKLIELDLNLRVLAVSSGAVYDPAQQMPETEDSFLKDIKSARPYEASKIMMEEELNNYANSGMEIIKVRPFNHIGPGQGPGFLVPDLANKLIAAKNTNQQIETGNLETRRDYTDVRDVVRAYADLAEAKSLAYDTYNICSGRSKIGSDILRLLMASMKLEDITIAGVDESLIRSNDASDVYGSYERINSETGWSPNIPIEKTIEDFVAWRLSQ